MIIIPPFYIILLLNCLVSGGRKTPAAMSLPDFVYSSASQSLYTAPSLPDFVYRTEPPRFCIQHRASQILYTAPSLPDFVYSTEPPLCSIKFILKVQRFFYTKKTTVKKTNYKVNSIGFIKVFDLTL